MKLVPMPKGGIFRAGRWDDLERYPPPLGPLNMRRPQLDGYRWDDALGQFATVKCSASAEAAIGRVFARYRPRIVDEGDGRGRSIIDRIMEFLRDEPDAGEPDLIDGRVPPDVFDDLYQIHIPSRPDVYFVDVSAEETIETLAAEFGAALTAAGLEFPVADLARHPDRRVTRLLLTTLHGRFRDGAAGKVAGIRYRGHPDAHWEAFVMWSEPEYISLVGDDVELRWVAVWDDEAKAAADRLGIALPPDPRP